MASYATEADCKQTWRTPGSFSNLYATVSANGVTATSTVNFRKDTGGGSANGNQSLSIGSGATGVFEDTSNSDSVSSGDKIDYQLVTGGSGTTITVNVITALFSATTNTSKRMATGSASTLSTANTTYFSKFSGATGGSTATTEANEQVKFLTAGTLKNGFASITVNSRTNSTSIKTRKSGVAGNISISVSTGLTGVFEDSSNTDTVAVNDLWNWGTTLGSTNNNFTIALFGIDFETTDGSGMYTKGSGSAGITQNTSTPTYYSVQGTKLDTTTEANTQMKSGIAVTCSNLEINVTSNSVSAASTLAFRKNAGSGSQSVSVTASTTGVFTDGTHTDSLVATDLINYLFSTGATGTSLVFRYMAMKVLYPTSVVNNGFFMMF